MTARATIVNVVCDLNFTAVSHLTIAVTLTGLTGAQRAHAVETRGNRARNAASEVTRATVFGIVRDIYARRTAERETGRTAARTATADASRTGRADIVAAAAVLVVRVSEHAAFCRAVVTDL